MARCIKRYVLSSLSMNKSIKTLLLLKNTTIEKKEDFLFIKSIP